MINGQKKAGIYCIINNINNKRYIGSTVNLNKRIKRHIREFKYKYHNNKHLEKAVYKYGIYNFDIIILNVYENITRQDLLNIENDYIIKYNTCNPLYGYNKRFNGSFPEFSKEVKARIHRVNKNNSIRILAFNAITGEFFKEFESINATAKYFKTSTHNIIICTNVLTRSCSGYVLIYKKLYDSSKIYKKRKVKKPKTKKQLENMLSKHKKAISIYVYNINSKQLEYTFLSIKQANIYFNLKTDSLSHLMKHYKYIIYNNYLFSYTIINDNDINDIIINTHKYIPKQ